MNAIKRGPDGIEYADVAPGSNLDWPIDWTQWLDGASIVTSVWSSDHGLTITNETNAAGITNCFCQVDPNLLGSEILLHNTVVTDDVPFRRDTRTLRLRVRHKSG